MTDDEIADRVKRCPELARVLFVHPITRKTVIRVAETVPGLNWHGVNIVEHPLLPTEAMVWSDKDGNVLAVQMPEAIDIVKDALRGCQAAALRKLKGAER